MGKSGLIARNSLVGYVMEGKQTDPLLTQSNSLTVLYRPEIEPGYQAPDPQKFATATSALRTLFGSMIGREAEIPTGHLHVVIDLRMGGYERGEVAKLGLVRSHLPEADVRAAWAVSARQHEDRTVVSYDKPVPVAVIVVPGTLENDQRIHDLAGALQLPRYAIDQPDIHETEWFTTSHAR